MIKGHNVDFCKENCLVVCILSCMSVLSHISGFEYFGSVVVFTVFLLCCPVVSLALTSYSLRPDYMSQKWIKLDVSRTEIRLDPFHLFPEGGNTCQYVMPFYSSVPIPSLL